jgi:hypothetical protein
MKHSESIKEIAAALAAFQSEVKDPSRNGENPHFKSKYVQLDGLLAAVRPILANHGLSLMQSTGGDGVNISVSTLIMHTSGEWIETEPLWALHGMMTTTETRQARRRKPKSQKPSRKQRQSPRQKLMR